MFYCSNRSNYKTIEEPAWFRKSWVWSQITNLCLMFITVFIFIYLVVTNFKKGNFKRARRNQTAFKLISLVLFTILSSLLTLIVSQVAIIIDRTAAADNCGDLQCDIIMKVSIVSFIISYMFTYIFLWYRMKNLYSQPTIKQIKNKWISFLIGFVLFTILCAALMHMFILLFFVRHYQTDSGCKQKKVFSIVTYLSYAVKVASNFVLFGLFYYPIRTHGKSMKFIMIYRRENRCSIKRNKRNTNLLNKIRLALRSMILCVISDFITTMVDSEVLPKNSPGIVINAIWDINLLFNIAAIVFTFKKIAIKVIRSSVRSQNLSIKGAVRKSPVFIKQ